MKWELDLWYEMWDRAGSQGLDIWYPVRGGPEAEDEPSPGTNAGALDGGTPSVDSDERL